VENGAWAPVAAKTMKRLLEGAADLSFCETTVTIRGALDEAGEARLEALADELCR
jgi:hypothetical protein